MATYNPLGSSSESTLDIVPQFYDLPLSGRDINDGSLLIMGRHFLQPGQRINLMFAVLDTSTQIEKESDLFENFIDSTNEEYRVEVILGNTNMK
mmetsp:Transcript_17418/g.26839  ORF Transcript_17418/g.26839 Transcript_17418/m.26839 type:complete len:94 (+) Transcript_17418:823-1104(+)|eukprot:CAMPEP_0170480998 /NCGR_PEP_ID=MMETSP0208-20121228/1613_1 /TAXON_ID=197538 /ORGANISM="Strombidium inclinatum, Strain S3" /LENGTH=93 /DNA_ID=CAMNT_0010753625 /DNA_START=823 /DNA_END=1104 /DNA_ORIENTATION=-